MQDYLSLSGYVRTWGKSIDALEDTLRRTSQSIKIIDTRRWKIYKAHCHIMCAGGHIMYKVCRGSPYVCDYSNSCRSILLTFLLIRLLIFNERRAIDTSGQTCNFDRKCSVYLHCNLDVYFTVQAPITSKHKILLERVTIKCAIE